MSVFIAKFEISTIRSKIIVTFISTVTIFNPKFVLNSHSFNVVPKKMKKLFYLVL